MSKVIMAKVADLCINPNYAQIYTIENQQRELLKDSIQSTGRLLEPIVITGNNIVVHGTQRFLACQELGWEEIPARYIDNTDDVDPTFLLINFNRNRDKSMLERWNEIKYLKHLYKKKQGERTDLRNDLSDFDKFNTRKKIALHCNIAEGNVYKIEKVASLKIELLNLISAGEMSLHEAYNTVMGKSNKSKSDDAENSSQLEEIHQHVCPNCKCSF